MRPGQAFKEFSKIASGLPVSKRSEMRQQLEEARNRALSTGTNAYVPFKIGGETVRFEFLVRGGEYQNQTAPWRKIPERPRHVKVQIAYPDRTP